MTDFPAQSPYLENAGRLQVDGQAWWNQLLDATLELPGGREAATLTISAGKITPTRCLHIVDTEDGAAADDLENLTFTNMPEGRLVLLRGANAGRVVTVKHAAGGLGQFVLEGAVDFALDSTSKWLLIVHDAFQAHEVCRCWGADVSEIRAHLGLGTAAIFDTGTTTGTVPLLTTGGALPAVSGQNLQHLNWRRIIGYENRITPPTAPQVLSKDTWVVRHLSGLFVNEGSVGSLASNQMTLIAGTYFVEAWAHAHAAAAVGTHQIRLYETTGTWIIDGSVEYCTLGNMTTSRLFGHFTIPGSRTFELQSFCSSAEDWHGGFTSPDLSAQVVFQKIHA